jgi:hypothetical protein
MHIIDVVVAYYKFDKGQLKLHKNKIPVTETIQNTQQINLLLM